MLKKTLLNGAMLSTLLFSLGSVWAADTLSGQSMEAGKMNTAPGMSHRTMQQTSGEIVGDFNRPDGAVMGATLPGKEVQFAIPMSSGKPQYLRPLQRQDGTLHRRQTPGLISLR